MVGAILTQQTAWKNVEKAISNLKKEGLLSPEGILNKDTEELAQVIKPAGFYNVKAERLKTFVEYFIKEYNGEVQKMKEKPLSTLRKELLSIKGIGKETADSILLYALDKRIFVVDAYTKRIYSRLGACESSDYETIRKTFESALSDKEFVEHINKNIKPAEDALVYIFKEMHALIVAEGKLFCKTKPLCNECPLNKMCKRKGVS